MINDILAKYKSLVDKNPGKIVFDDIEEKKIIIWGNIINSHINSASFSNLEKTFLVEDYEKLVTAFCESSFCAVTILPTFLYKDRVWQTMNMVLDDEWTYLRKIDKNFGKSHNKRFVIIEKATRQNNQLAIYNVEQTSVIIDPVSFAPFKKMMIRFAII